MPPRVLLTAAAAIGVVLVLAVSVSRVTLTVAGQPVACPDRVLPAAVQGLTDRDPDPCAAASQQRLFTVAAALMGLVLISGVLARRRD